MKHTKGKIQLEHGYTPNILIGEKYNSGTDAEFATYVSHPVQKKNKAMANAKRLIKCWNMHDELLECLGYVLGSFSLERTENFELLNKCKEAIKKATQ